MTLASRTRILLAVLPCASLLLALPPAAKAGLVLGPPTYLGLSSGLVGWWTFDGNDVSMNNSGELVAYDRAANLNSASTTGAAGSEPTQTQGKIGQALNFDATNDLLDAGSHSSIDNIATVTISAWIKPNTVTGPMEIVAKQGNGGNSTVGPDLYVESGTLRFAQGTNGTTWAWSAGTITTRAWHRVLITYSRDLVATAPVMYVNGISQSVSVAQPGNSTAKDDSAEDLGIGVYGAEVAGASFFDGSIDEVRIYNRVLSADEVKRLYKIGSTLKYGAPNSSGSLSSGLVGWWTFDGNDMATNNSGVRKVMDRSGNNKPGTLDAGMSVLPGKIGQSLLFNGSTDAVSLGTGLSTNLGPLSVSVWAYPLADDAGHFISNGEDGCRSDAASGGWQFQVGWFSGTQRRLCFEADFGVGDPAHILIAETVTNTFVSGKWQHFAVTWDGTIESDNVHIYVDGVEKAFTTKQDGVGARFSDVGQTMHLGGTNSVNSGWNGMLDDFRLYNRELTADEIKRLYKIGSTLKYGAPNSTGSLSQGLVGWWTMDGNDVAGVTTYDRSGQGTNGTLTNGPARTIGKIGQALTFDGSTNGVEFASAAALDLQPPLSISLWFKTPAPAAQQSMFVAGSNCCAASEYELGVNDNFGTPFAYFHFRRADDTNTQVTADFTPGQWNHAVGVYDGVRNRIYMNTVLGEDEAETQGIFEAANTASIGSNFLSNQFFNGSIDDVRIYNRALTPDEIKRLYKMGR